MTGRPDEEPYVSSRYAGGESGTYDISKKEVLGDEPLCDDGSAVMFDDGKQVAEAVAQTPGGIGFVSLPLTKGLETAWIYRAIRFRTCRRSTR